jgi:hypothetical protein
MKKRTILWLMLLYGFLVLLEVVRKLALAARRARRTAMPDDEQFIVEDW